MWGYAIIYIYIWIRISSFCSDGFIQSFTHNLTHRECLGRPHDAVSGSQHELLVDEDARAHEGTHQTSVVSNFVDGSLIKNKRLVDYGNAQMHERTTGYTCKGFMEMHHLFFSPVSTNRCENR